MSLNPGHYTGRGGLAQEGIEGYIKITPNGDQIIGMIPCGPSYPLFPAVYFTTERIRSSLALRSDIIAQEGLGNFTKMEYGSSIIWNPPLIEVSLTDLLVMCGSSDSLYSDLYDMNRVESGFLLDVDRVGVAQPSPGFTGGSIATQLDMLVTDGVIHQAYTDPTTLDRQVTTKHFRQDTLRIFGAGGVLPGPDCFLYTVDILTGTVTPLVTFNALDDYILYFFSATLRDLQTDAASYTCTPLTATQEHAGSLRSLPLLGIAVPSTGFPDRHIGSNLDLAADRIAIELYWGPGSWDRITYLMPVLAVHFSLDGGGLLVDSDISGIAPQSTTLRSGNRDNPMWYTT